MSSLVDVTFTAEFKTEGLDKLLKTAEQKSAVIGILRDVRHPLSKESLVDIAKANEFGSIKNNIPARSFLLSPIRYKLPNSLREYGESLKTIFVEQSLHSALNLVGILGVDVIKNTILMSDNGEGRLKPNAPYTIKKKGFDHPLLETSFLFDHISYKIQNDKS